MSYCDSHNYLLDSYGEVVGGVDVQEPQPRQAKQDGSWILREDGGESRRAVYLRNNRISTCKSISNHT